MSEKGTEQATPQRKAKAKARCDVVRSRELLSAMAMLGGIVMLGMNAPSLVASWGRVFVASLRAAGAGQAGEQNWSEAVRQMIGPAVMPIGLVMAASFSAALIVGVAQGGGVSIHPEAISMKFTRLNPVSNLANLFSLRSAIRTVKSLVPAAVMIALGWSALKTLMLPMPVMSLLRLPDTFTTAYRLTVDAAWVTLAWSGLDYAIEWRSWNQRLKMSKQEMRDEMRDAMGNPQIKMRIRQVQMAMRKRRVKADMSRATVVITNPTHYAVALEFSFDTMQAPTVLAKGRDLLAAEIREEARWLGIPMIENPPLARSLYKSVDPGQSIPFDLYAAVAGILAYLYRQKLEERKRQERQSEANRRETVSAAGMSGRAWRDYGGGM